MSRLLSMLCLLLVLVSTSARAAEPTIGRIVRLDGDVVVVRHARVMPLSEGAELLEGDVLRTAPDAKARLESRAGLTVTIGGGSEVELARYLAAPDGGRLEAVLRLVSGIVRLVGEPRPGVRRIEVETRTAVASVRSTDWLVEITTAGTGVFVATGSVEVLGMAGGGTILEPGQGTDVAPGMRPAPAKTWGQARRDRALARTTF